MMTASSPPSGVHDRLKRDHLVGGVLALLVQAGFLLLVLLAPSDSTRRASLVRETLLSFPPRAVPAPSTINAPGPRRKRIAPSDTLPVPPIASPPVAVSPLAPPSGLAGFGQALFGCAPEHYADLTPDRRAHCPKPGEGLANKEQPDLMDMPSHVKDNARWANAMAHKQTLRMLPGGMLFPLVALGAVLDGSMGEPHSAFRDPEQWPNERDTSQFMPRNLNDQEHIYDAWRKDHPIPPPKN
jgi:hypothetical protein